MASKKFSKLGLALTNRLKVFFDTGADQV
jgi:hypothetical protein